MNTKLSPLTTGMMLASLLPSAVLGATMTQNSDVSLQQSSGFLNTFIEGDTNQDGVPDTFDIRAFRAHPCYSAVGDEQNYCLRLFGITTDFESMIQDSSFNNVLLQHTLNQRCQNLSGDERTRCVTQNATILPRLLDTLNQSGTGFVLSDGDEDVEEDTQEDPVMSRYERSQHLWALCEGSNLTQGGCHQNFLRFVTDETVTIADIEDVITPGVHSSSNANKKKAQDYDENDVQSDTDEDLIDPAARSQWLWELCAESDAEQSMCYRNYFRSAMRGGDTVSIETMIRDDQF